MDIDKFEEKFGIWDYQETEKEIMAIDRNQIMAIIQDKVYISDETMNRLKERYEGEANIKSILKFRDTEQARVVIYKEDMKRLSDDFRKGKIETITIEKKGKLTTISDGIKSFKRLSFGPDEKVGINGRIFRDILKTIEGYQIWEIRSKRPIFIRANKYQLAIAPKDTD